VGFVNIYCECNISSFVILSVRFIFIIRLKHLFTNICSLLVIWFVVFQVSQEHNNNIDLMVNRPSEVNRKSDKKKKRELDWTHIT